MIWRKIIKLTEPRNVYTHGSFLSPKYKEARLFKNLPYQTIQESELGSIAFACASFLKTRRPFMCEQIWPGLGSITSVCASPVGWEASLRCVLRSPI